MNEVRPPKGSPERALWDRVDFLAGFGPLHGTNIGKRLARRDAEQEKAHGDRSKARRRKARGK